MKIEKVTFTDDEINQIYDSMVELFDSRISTKQFTKFDLNELVSVEAELELDIEYSELDENNQNSIKHVYVHKFDYWFMIDGEEVLTNLKKSAVLDRQIEKYYHI